MFIINVFIFDYFDKLIMIWIQISSHLFLILLSKYKILFNWNTHFLNLFSVILFGDLDLLLEESLLVFREACTGGDEGLYFFLSIDEFLEEDEEAEESDSEEEDEDLEEFS